VADLRPLALIVAVTAIIITTIIAMAYTTAHYSQNQVAKKEYEIALEMVKQCGEREWVAWFEYAPLEGRRVKCLERKPKPKTKKK